MSAARHMSGMASTISTIWSERTFSAGGRIANGPRPETPPRIARATTVRSDRLVPVGPRRTAAQTRNGTMKASGMVRSTSKPLAPVP